MTELQNCCTHENKDSLIGEDGVPLYYCPDCDNYIWINWEQTLSYPYKEVLCD